MIEEFEYEELNEYFSHQESWLEQELGENLYYSIKEELKDE